VEREQELKWVRRARRVKRVRKKIFGTPERPRLAVFRSQKHIYAQIIDDLHGHTLVSCSTLDPEIRGQVRTGANKEAARLVGQVLGRRAVAAGIEKVCFDRRHYKYHGRVAALAEGAREAGLKF
jgi:large subunit ribosomal protein L18